MDGDNNSKGHDRNVMESVIKSKTMDDDVSKVTKVNPTSCDPLLNDDNANRDENGGEVTKEEAVKHTITSKSLDVEHSRTTKQQSNGSVGGTDTVEVSVNPVSETVEVSVNPFVSTSADGSAMKFVPTAIMPPRKSGRKTKRRFPSDDVMHSEETDVVAVKKGRRSNLKPAPIIDSQKLLVGAYAHVHGVEKAVSEFHVYPDIDTEVVREFKDLLASCVDVAISFKTNLRQRKRGRPAKLPPAPAEVDAKSAVHKTYGSENIVSAKNFDANKVPEHVRLEIGAYACIYGVSSILTLYQTLIPIENDHVKVWKRAILEVVNPEFVRACQTDAIEDLLPILATFSTNEKWEIAQYATMHSILDAVQNFSAEHPSITPDIVKVFVDAHANISRSVQESERTEGESSRGIYAKYTPEERAEIGRFAHESSPRITAAHFRYKFPRLNDSTVCNFLKAYRKVLEKDSQQPIVALPQRSRGRPPLLGRLDNEVRRNLELMRDAGAKINSSVVIATARGIMQTYDQFKLKEHGGYIQLSKGWATCMLKRLGLIPNAPNDDTAEVSTEYIEQARKEITSAVMITAEQCLVPKELILSFDYSPLRLVPIGKYSMEIGDKVVVISGEDDKRSVCGLVTTSLSGAFLTTVLIYPGKTHKVHPTFIGNGITYRHTGCNSMAVEADMLENYLKTVLIPHVKEVRNRLRLAPKYPALLMCNKTAVVLMDNITKLFTDNGIIPVKITLTGADQLQPAYLSGMVSLKNYVKAEFQSWYVAAINRMIRDGKSVEVAQEDLSSLAFLREKQAHWIAGHYDYITRHPDVAARGFAEIGLLQAYDASEICRGIGSADPKPWSTQSTDVTTSTASLTAPASVAMVLASTTQALGIQDDSLRQQMVQLSPSSFSTAVPLASSANPPFFHSLSADGQQLTLTPFSAPGDTSSIDDPFTVINAASLADVFLVGNSEPITTIVVDNGTTKSFLKLDGDPETTSGC